MPCQASSARYSIRFSGGSMRWVAEVIAGAMVCLIVLLLVVLGIAFASGCTRTVLVSEASPLRTGPGVSGKVYTKTSNGEWQLSDNKVTIPEGWYCVPPSYVEAAQP